MNKTPGEILHRYGGQGTLSIEDDNPVVCPFIFTQEQDGTLRLTCTINIDPWRGAEEESRLRKAAKFEGVTGNGLNLNCERLNYAGSRRQHTLEANFLCLEATLAPATPPEEEVHSLRAQIVNLNLCCERYEDLTFPNGLRVPWQQTPLEMGDAQLTLVPLQDISATINKLKETRGITVTCEAAAPLADIEELASWEERLIVLGSLLTFLYGTRVNWISYDVLSASGALLKRVCRVPATSGYGAHIAEQTWSATTWVDDQAAFIKEAYDRFEQVWDDWDIYAVINLFTELRGQVGFSEVAGVQLASCLEIINNGYLGRTGRKHILKNFDKKVKPDLKKAINSAIEKMKVDVSPLEGEERETAGRSNSELEDKQVLLTDNLINVNHYPFARALREICTQLNFEPGEEAIERFKRNRNLLVHTGLFDVPRDGLKPETLPARER